ncbi:hypothetical protein C8F04DRAFT_1261136 [Mycena alexandri]|uniref:Uncharacterized protein n=1 Tax=Mycena alexandri TaxID=1745969 RepID=A0AAD6X5W6_9AGAR|nr:hypothetical protein C8F04DRAFT_1261136 [Mycena alexandri]
MQEGPVSPAAQTHVPLAERALLSTPAPRESPAAPVSPLSLMLYERVSNVRPSGVDDVATTDADIRHLLYELRASRSYHLSLHLPIPPPLHPASFPLRSSSRIPSRVRPRPRAAPIETSWVDGAEHADADAQESSESQRRAGDGGVWRWWFKMSVATALAVPTMTLRLGVEDLAWSLAGVGGEPVGSCECRRARGEGHRGREDGPVRAAGGCGAATGGG